MTDRRPHWNDDLIEAVREAALPRNLYSEDIYAIIAAVEDWQSRNAIRLVSDLQGRLMQREATIQRVWDVLEQYAVVPYSEMSQTDALGAIREALDGER